MRYPHTLKITRETSGYYDSDDNWVPGGETTVYEGKCDFQDADAVEFNSDSGSLSLKSVDGMIFLKDEGAVTSIQLDDTGTVTVMQTDMDIVVKGKRHLDGVIEVDY